MRTNKNAWLVVLWTFLQGSRWLCAGDNVPFTPTRRYDQHWRVSSFAEDAGLTGHTVADLAFETNGTLWAATTAGLYRFDGYRWAHFGTGDGLPSLNVSCVLVTREGKLWVGTDKGSGVFDGNRCHSQGSETNLAGPSVRRMAEDPDGTVWFCSHLWPDGVVRAGLTSYKDGTWTAYRKAQGLPHDHVLNYFCSAEDEHYLVTSGGMAQKEGSRWVISPINEKLPEPPWCISGSPRQPVLIALFAGAPNQVFLRQTNQWRMVTCNPDYPRQTVMSLLSTRDGQILACLDGGKESRIHQWNGVEFAPVSAPLFAENTTQPPASLVEAPDGSVWVCGTGFLVRWDRGEGKWAEYADLPSPRGLDLAGLAVFDGGNGAFWLSGDGAVPATNLTAALGDGSGLGWLVIPGSSTVSELRRGNTSRRFDQAQTGLKQPRTVIWNRAGRTWATGNTADGRNAIALFDGGAWQTLAPPDLQEKTFRPPVSRDAADLSDPGGGTWFLLSRPLTNSIRRLPNSCLRLFPCRFRSARGSSLSWSACS